MDKAGRSVFVSEWPPACESKEEAREPVRIFCRLARILDGRSFSLARRSRVLDLSNVDGDDGENKGESTPPPPALFSSFFSSLVGEDAYCSRLDRGCAGLFTTLSSHVRTLCFSREIAIVLFRADSAVIRPWSINMRVQGWSIGVITTGDSIEARPEDGGVDNDTRKLSITDSRPRRGDREESVREVVALRLGAPRTKCRVMYFCEPSIMSRTSCSSTPGLNNCEFIPIKTSYCRMPEERAREVRCEL